ncbi:MAG: hypothetical protein DMG21_15170, partial [Acidobacteria bacterium]
MPATKSRSGPPRLPLLLAAAFLTAAATRPGLEGPGALAQNRRAVGDAELRLRLPFNDGWRFKRQAAPGAAVEAEFVGAEKPAYDDSTWGKVNLPHTWDA